MTSHPLDRPAWSALAGRQSHLALVEGGALRMDPDFGLFAGTADDSPESLAALGELVRAHGDVGLVERFDPPPVPGTRVVSRALCWQMVAENLAAPKPANFAIEPLTPADAPDMLALIAAAGVIFGLYGWARRSANKITA